MKSSFIYMCLGGSEQSELLTVVLNIAWHSPPLNPLKIADSLCSCKESSEDSERGMWLSLTWDCFIILPVQLSEEAAVSIELK